MRLRRLALAGLGLALASAGPAFAADCRTNGDAKAKAIAFPTNTPSDAEFAKAAQTVVLPETYNRLPSELPCWRLTFPTAQGEYEMGGENPQPFARIAFPKGGTKGPVVYMFKVDGAALGHTDVYALATYQKGAQVMVKRFYDGLPPDELIANDIAVAAASAAGLIVYDTATRAVALNFPANAAPGIPPAAPAPASPQIAVAGKPEDFLTQSQMGLRHKASGFVCPETFSGLPVMLNVIDPKATSMACRYRAGAGLEHDPNAAVRYQIEIDKAPGVTAKAVFDALIPQAMPSFKVTGDKPPPIAAGALPGPEQVGYFSTESGQSLGVFINVTNGWLVRVRTLVPASQENDAEAGRIARALFDSVAAQIKAPGLPAPSPVPAAPQ